MYIYNGKDIKHYYVFFYFELCIKLNKKCYNRVLSVNKDIYSKLLVKQTAVEMVDVCKVHHYM